MFKWATCGKHCTFRLDLWEGYDLPRSSFLPQDKVSEFAQMTPQQLLKETQRAAGDERLTSWHETLTNAGQELKTLSLVSDLRLVEIVNAYSLIVS